MNQLARTTDPETSHEAAAELVDSGKHQIQKAKVYNALLWCNRAQQLAPTSAELARHSGLDRYLVARRLADLEKAGLVDKVRDDDGELIKRKCSVNGSRATVWRVK
jgi:DNA-binding MarR family transcriptional regulator